jgi:hypothetical protein
LKVEVEVEVESEEERSARRLNGYTANLGTIILLSIPLSSQNLGKEIGGLYFKPAFLVPLPQ